MGGRGGAGAEREKKEGKKERERKKSYFHDLINKLGESLNVVLCSCFWPLYDSSENPYHT